MVVKSVDLWQSNVTGKSLRKIEVHHWENNQSIYIYIYAMHGDIWGMLCSLAMFDGRRVGAMLLLKTINMCSDLISLIRPWDALGVQTVWFGGQSMRLWRHMGPDGPQHFVFCLYKDFWVRSGGLFEHFDQILLVGVVGVTAGLFSPLRRHFKHREPYQKVQRYTKVPKGADVAFLLFALAIIRPPDLEPGNNDSLPWKLDTSLSAKSYFSQWWHLLGDGAASSASPALLKKISGICYDIHRLNGLYALLRSITWAGLVEGDGWFSQCKALENPWFGEFGLGLYFIFRGCKSKIIL